MDILPIKCNLNIILQLDNGILKSINIPYLFNQVMRLSAYTIITHFQYRTKIKYSTSHLMTLLDMNNYLSD